MNDLNILADFKSTLHLLKTKPNLLVFSSDFYSICYFLKGLEQGLHLGRRFSNSITFQSWLNRENGGVLKNDWVSYIFAVLSDGNDEVAKTNLFILYSRYIEDTFRDL